MIKKDFDSRENVITLLNYYKLKWYLHNVIIIYIIDIDKNVQYGNDFIELLSKSLKLEFPSAKGYSSRNLHKIRRIYAEYKDLSILPMSLEKLPWSFNCLLIDRTKELDKSHYRVCF